MTEMEMGESVTATAADNQPSAEDVRAALVGSVLGTCNTLLHYSSQVCVSGALDIEVDDKHLFTLKICHSMVRNQVQESGISITEKMMKKEVSDVMPEDLWKELLPGTSSDQRDSYNLVREDPDPGELGHDNVMDADNGDDGDDWEPSRAGTSPARGKRRSSRRLSAAQGSATSPPVNRKKRRSSDKTSCNNVNIISPDGTTVKQEFVSNSQMDDRFDQDKSQQSRVLGDIETLTCPDSNMCHTPLKDESFGDTIASLGKESIINDSWKKINMPYKCMVCFKDFKFVSTLKRHSYIHITDKPHRCLVCNKGFIEKSKMQKHQTKCQKPDPAEREGNAGLDRVGNDNLESCEIDGKNVELKDIECVVPKKDVYWRPYSCAVCQKAMIKSSDLLRHTLSVTHQVAVAANAERASKPFMCSHCFETFAVMAELTRHLRTHKLGRYVPAGNSSQPQGVLTRACETCGKIFRTKSDLDRHMYTHADKKPYSCGGCQRGFIEKYKLRKHTAKCKAYREKCQGEVPEVFKGKCSLCEQLFESLDELKEHSRVHMQDDLFSCPGCGEIFAELGMMESHAAQCGGRVKGDKHASQNQKYESFYACGVCEVSIQRARQMKNHMSTEKHMRQAALKLKADKPYMCGKCHESFPGLTQLKEHIASHVVENKLICEFCGGMYTSQHTLNQHLIRHSGNFPCVCEVCAKGFPNMTDLRRHLTTHKLERDWKCQTCGKGFKSKGGLQHHMESHKKERPYACSVCKKTFRSRVEVDIHKKIHMQKSYQCKLCLRSFAQPATFRQHRFFHTNARPYICPICNKGFKMKYSLTIHKKVHSNDKPYSCLYCSTRFKYRSCLRDHQKRFNHK